ncbi:MAG TPA: hypothetical protein EYQ84_07145, partial [Nitrospinaceae bacterium]|nr:hypothetical protein [Nitrospinaceae bacterium]
MPFDFMKGSIMNDDERFAKLCESIEDCIREVNEGEGIYSDLEIMQAINFVGFNFFRDDWEEFKKSDSSKDGSFEMMKKESG